MGIHQVLNNVAVAHCDRMYENHHIWNQRILDQDPGLIPNLIMKSVFVPVVILLAKNLQKLSRMLGSLLDSPLK